MGDVQEHYRSLNTPKTILTSKLLMLYKCEYLPGCSLFSLDFSTFTNSYLRLIPQIIFLKMHRFIEGKRARCCTVTLPSNFCVILDLNEIAITKK